MKHFLRTFFVCLICMLFLGFSRKTYAEYIPNTKCPVAPDKMLVSICGVVKSAKPTRALDKNGKVIYEAPIGVPGVSVYVYECDNQSPSCKFSGDLVHIFSSTSSNEDGMFYLWARKLDTFIPLITGGTPRNFSSKKRYLVFSCGNKIAGMQEIPSYLDQTYVVQEVDCGSAQAYVSPQARMSILPSQSFIASQPTSTAPGDLLSNQMGNDWWDQKCATYKKNGDTVNYDAYCVFTSGSYINHLTAQFSYRPQQSATAPSGFAPINNITPNVSMNFDLDLKNADPRFVYGNAGGQFWIDVANAMPLPGANINPFAEGSWWVRDCWVKYKGKKFAGVDNTDFCMILPPVNADPTPYIQTYTYRLYNNPDFLIQNKLPDIPPINSLIFYKEFTARQDITEYIQDPTDPAKFLSLQFSNCMGQVFLRKDGQEAKDKYVACSQLQKCSGVLSKESSYLNNQTTGGPSQHLASPTTFQDEFLASVDLNTPVCKIHPDIPVGTEPAITIGEIQPPWDPTGSYTLDSTYWSNEFIYYFGKNNVTGKEAVQGESYNDSIFASGTPVNTKTFQTAEEAAVQPFREGTYAMFPSGGNKPNNSTASGVYISSNTATGDSSNSLTSLLSSPLKAQDPIYEIVNVLRGIVIPTTGSRTMRVGEYSRVNVEYEIPVSAPADDMTNLAKNSNISNILFKGDPDHHPAVDTDLTMKNGTRSATSATYFTDPAIRRILNLQGKITYDIYDSFLSILYGSGTLDLTSPVAALAFGQATVQSVWNAILFPNDKKTFLDRKNANTIPKEVEIRNDLQTKFTLSEENFTNPSNPEYYKLPVYPNLNKSDWGTGSACYPWHQMYFTHRCNTDDTESPNKISRTCRVDTCKKMEFKCYCNLVLGVETKSCTLQVSDTSCSAVEKLLCAQNQITTSRSAAPQPGDPNYVKDLADYLIQLGLYSSEGDFLRHFYSRTGSQNPHAIASAEATANGTACNGYPSTYTVLVDNAPSCVVSMAGPYICGGELKKDAEFVTRSATLPDNPRTDRPPQSVNSVDSLIVANNELRKSFQAPDQAKLTYAPAAFQTGDSSIRNVCPTCNDITKRKDSVGAGGDTQNASITRAVWSAPLLMSNPVYNKINLHCTIIDGPTPDGGFAATFIGKVMADKQMGLIKPASDNWKCDVNEPPDPEIVDLDKYINSHTVDGSCNFNPSDACVTAIYPANKDTGKITFSDTFVKVLNAAANRMKIPASVIVSIAKMGKADKYGYYFTPAGEEELVDASLPWYGGLPGCDEMNSASVGVYDWIRVWFDAVIQGKLITGGTVQKALDELAIRRSMTAARCNFLDSTFVIAAALKNATGNAGSCGSITWEQAKTALSKVGWGSDLSAAPGGWSLPGQYEQIFNACKN